MADAGQSRINQGGGQLRSHNAAVGLKRFMRPRLIWAATVRAFLCWLQAHSKRRHQQSHQQDSHCRALKSAPQHDFRLPLWAVFSVIPVTNKALLPILRISCPAPRSPITLHMTHGGPIFED